LYPLYKIPNLSDLTTRRSKKRDLSKIIITNQQKFVLFRFISQIDYKQPNKVRKVNLFSNINTFSDMLRIQDFALNISKFSCGGMSPILPR
jgi:hypothetical protein